MTIHPDMLWRSIIYYVQLCPVKIVVACNGLEKISCDLRNIYWIIVHASTEIVSHVIAMYVCEGGHLVTFFISVTH